MDQVRARDLLGLGILGPVWGRQLAMAARIVVWMPLLVSCAATMPNSDSGVLEGDWASSRTAPSPSESSAEADAESQAITADRSEGQMFVTGGANVRLPEAKPPLRLEGDAVMLNFEQAPLTEVVHTILGDTLGLDYVIEHPVKGEITIRTRSPIPRDELLPILESLLRNNNVLMVRGPDDRFFVSGAANMKTTMPSFASSPDFGFANVIVPLQYIGANEMAEILRPVAPGDAFVRIDQRRNLLILSGTQTQLEGWLDIVATFDVDQLNGMAVGIFPVTSATVEALFKELQHIMNTASGGDATGIASVVRVMPVERLNSVLVVSPTEEYVKQVGEWIAKLDTAGESSSEATLHVYSVRNGDSAHLASLLSQIYGGKGGGKKSGPQGVAPGMTRASSGGAASGVSSDMPSTGGSGDSAPSVIQLAGDVRVVSDQYNNTLLVYSTAHEYARIESILRSLDVIATQVLIEASIVEVTLIDELEYGLEWAFSGGLGGGDTGSGLLNLGSSGAIGPMAPGFSYTVTNSAGAVKAVLNMLAQKSLINVISTPSIMVLDNHTAAIHVGDQQPIQSSSVVTNGGNTQTSITYKDTGVKLEVTPSVNDGGLVTMDVKQSVTDVGVVDAATGQRSFLERNVSSRIAIRNGESVVLGGLIRDNASTGKNGIPLLMDIPVLGNLFSTTTDSVTRTELLVFITPRVLENEDDMRELNREMRSRMRGLKKFEDLPVSVTGVQAASQ